MLEMPYGGMAGVQSGSFKMRQSFHKCRVWLILGLLTNAIGLVLAQTDDIFEFSVSDLNVNQLRVSVKYRYASYRGDKIQLSCVPLLMQEGELRPDYKNFRRSSVMAIKGGDFRAVLELSYVGGEMVRSEKIRVFLRGIGEPSPLFKKDFVFVKAWGTVERVKPIRLDNVDLAKECASIWQKSRATVARAAHVIQQKGLDPELLAPARRQQYRSQQLYTSGNYNAAVAHSLYARELARELIKSQGGQVTDADLANAREEALAQYSSPAELKAAVKGLKFPEVKPGTIPEDTPANIKLLPE